MDQDNHSLSDVYEFIYFGGPTDAFADPDGDGISNYDEVIWGTKLNDATSKVTGPTARPVGDTVQP